MVETIDNVTDAVVPEAVTSLDDLAEAPGGSWPKGWYLAEIIEGYKTRKGKVVQTEDTTSKNGDSRNARFCMNVDGPGGERQMNVSFNYRTSDFGADRIAFIKQQRVEHKDVQGKWADDPDAQRTSLALAKIGAFGKGIGTKDGDVVKGVVLHTEDGVIATQRAIGKRLWVYLVVNEDGYNDATKFDHVDNRK